MYKRRKFNPPLKKGSDGSTNQLSQLSVSAPASEISHDSCNVSLPPSQTHTLLSLCDLQQDSQPKGMHSPQPTSNCNPHPTGYSMQASNRFSIHRQKESYKYSMYTFQQPKTKLRTRKTVTITQRRLPQHAVYDFTLTQSQAPSKAKQVSRTKEQARLSLKTILLYS